MFIAIYRIKPTQLNDTLLYPHKELNLILPHFLHSMEADHRDTVFIEI
jgi:hypothetical protein